MAIFNFPYILLALMIDFTCKFHCSVFSGEKEALELESNARQIDIPITFEYIGVFVENKRGDRTRGVYIPNLIAESGPLLVLQPRASILCRRD